MPHERAADTRGQLRVNGPRLLHRIATLATIGATADGGVTRAGFSDADREGIHWVMSEAREAGLRTWVDPAGNMFAEFAESPSTADSRPVLLLGSHLDSVVNGGRLDGAYGVLAGLEVLQTLAEYATELPVRPRVVAFANEEGAEVPIPFFGSLAAAGRLLPEWTDVLQRRAPQLREPLRLVGGDLDRLAEAELDVDGVAGYLELHIEQGIGLESKEVTVGIVDAIVGKILWEVDIRGTQSHAGTTPMSSRSDATLAAADLVRSVHHLGVHHCQVATVGRIETPGGVPNTVCSSARISVDVRDPDQERLDAVETLFKERCRAPTASTARGALPKWSPGCVPHRPTPDCVRR